MNYRKVYFDEDNQKVRWTSNSSEDIAFTYRYVGSMTKVEFDLFIEVLWELYQDGAISLNEFREIFGDLRDFCDRIKNLVR